MRNTFGRIERLLLLTAFSILAISGWAEKKNRMLSRSFELRYVTCDDRANGETDYKGATAWMTTDQRVEYLTQWQRYVSRYFGDETLAEQVVSASEVADAMKRLKPQPLPSVRQELVLDEWRWAPSATHRQPLASRYSFERQVWRFRLEMDVDGTGMVRLMDGPVVVCEYLNDGQPHKAVFEVDLTKEERRYNLRLDERLVVDFQPLKTNGGGVNGCSAM